MQHAIAEPQTWDRGATQTIIPWSDSYNKLNKCKHSAPIISEQQLERCANDAQAISRPGTKLQRTAYENRNASRKEEKHNFNILPKMRQSREIRTIVQSTSLETHE